MAIQVYHEPLCRRYYASRASCAYLFYAFTTFLLLSLPFFLAYTGVPAFWLRTATFREQPNVAYAYKLLLQFDGVGLDGAPTQAFFSTVNSINALHDDALRVPVVRSAETDANRDGLVDRLNVEALMPLLPGERVYSVTALVLFDLRLERRARVQTEAVAAVAHGSGVPGRALWHDADLMLRQRWPLRVRGGTDQLYADAPLLDAWPLARASAREFGLPRLLATYRDRNVTTELANAYTVWSPAPAGGGVAPLDGSGATFNFSLTVRVPQQDVLYTPTVSETLKDGWVKYLAMFVVVYYLLDRLLAFAYYHQLVETAMHVELPTSRWGAKTHYL